MKKLLALCLAIILAISCCACGSSENGDNTSTATSAQDNTTTESSDNAVSLPEDEQDIVADTDDEISFEENTDVDDTSSENVSSNTSRPTSSNTSSKNETNNSSVTNTSSNTPSKPTSSTSSKEEVVSSAGSSTCAHTYKAATCTKPKTCTKCGKTQGSKLGHNYAPATCTRPNICKVCGVMSGKTLGHNYILGECTTCNDYSKSYCPKLYFTGDMSKITDPNQRDKKIECDITFEYRSREQIKTGAAKIKIQGSSSTKWRKKNYTINFYQDSNYSKKQKIDVGWGAQSKYCLKANWIDKTHSRNLVTAKLAGMIQNKYGLLTVAPNNGAVDGFPVEIYINGEFHGLYTMNIPKDEWQFGMDKDNPNHIVIGGGGWEDPVRFKAIPTKFSESGFEVEAGPENDETLKKLQRLVDFVLNSSDTDFKKNFGQYLNLDSTLNYYIMMNYAWTPDNTGKNMLLATYDGKVWYPSLYDLDTTWGTHWEGNKEYNYSTGFINGNDSMLWSRFEKHFKKEIAARYFELREDILDPNNVMNMFNQFYNSIPKEVLDRETAKWTLPDDPIPGYDLTQIQRYLNTVIPRLDARFASWK
ncbi:MAG: CotH kinase family protein [Clostridia bacterium]|nr:CotH kinase family protein [Clostridia bacterium]